MLRVFLVGLSNPALIFVKFKSQSKGLKSIGAFAQKMLLLWYKIKSTHTAFKCFWVKKLPDLPLITKITVRSPPPFYFSPTHSPVRLLPRTQPSTSFARRPRRPAARRPRSPPSATPPVPPDPFAFPVKSPGLTCAARL